jgi:hypothetical protein
MTWSGQTAATAIGFTAANTSVDSLAWAQLTAVTEQDDVDFRLKARDEFPMRAMTDRPLKALTGVISTP